MVAREQPVDATPDGELERTQQRLRDRAGPGRAEVGSDAERADRGSAHAAAGRPSSRRGCGVAAITASRTSSAERSSASAWYVEHEPVAEGVLDERADVARG